MVTTDQLIEALGRDVAGVSRHAVIRRVAIGIVAGGVVATLLVVATFGVRHDLRLAMRDFSFWMKPTYTVSLGLGAIYAINRLARPTSGSLRMLWLLIVPVLILAGIGIAEFARTPSSDWLAMWLGGSWKLCPRRVLTISVPIFAGLLWAFRTLAPTRLRAAGAATGLAAGARGATIYCLHCNEESAVFVLTWYSLGVLLAVGLGALLGPRLLRW